MKKRNGYLAAGALGAAVLGSMVALGHVEDRMATRAADRTAIGNKVSERQMLERRRGRVAEAAIAGTTVQ